MKHKKGWYWIKYASDGDTLYAHYYDGVGKLYPNAVGMVNPEPLPLPEPPLENGYYWVRLKKISSALPRPVRLINGYVEIIGEVQTYKPEDFEFGAKIELDVEKAFK